MKNLQKYLSDNKNPKMEKLQKKIKTAKVSSRYKKHASSDQLSSFCKFVVSA